MKKILMTLMILGLFAIPAFQPKAEAIDPVTIAILTPVAIKAAQIAAPYVIRGMKSGAVHMLTMGRDLIDIFRLPVGALQTTIGIPFSQFRGGVRNLVIGAAAPFKLTWKILIMPLAFCNIGIG